MVSQTQAALAAWRPFRRPHFIEGSARTGAATACAAGGGRFGGRTSLRDPQVKRGAKGIRTCGGRFGGRTSLRAAGETQAGADARRWRPFRRPHFIEGGHQHPNTPIWESTWRPFRRPHFIEGPG